jgi:hypothetical protein
LAGDLAAAKLVLERTVPPMRERPVSVRLPGNIVTATGINEAAGEILRAVCAGDLLPGEGQTLAAILELRRRSIETEDLERRIGALEAKKNAN